MRDDLDAASLLVAVLPRPVAQPAFDGDLPPFREVVGAELGLLIPRRDAEEIGLVRLRRSVDCEPEGGEPLLLAELAQLDIARESADQDHVVHVRRLLLSFSAT